jgi:hypothetical protein
MRNNYIWRRRINHIQRRRIEMNEQDRIAMEQDQAPIGDGNTGGHVAMKCSPQRDGKPAHHDNGEHCPYCEDEIFACKVCGCIEGSLASHCPGVDVSDFEQQVIYKGLLDYHPKRKWHVRAYLSHEVHDTKKELVAKVVAWRLNRRTAPELCRKWARWWPPGCGGLKGHDGACGPGPFGMHER